jgi:hypothetical protein
MKMKIILGAIAFIIAASYCATRTGHGVGNGKVQTTGGTGAHGSVNDDPTPLTNSRGGGAGTHG